MSKIDDIKLIRIKTKDHFGLEECRLAYEKCDCDVSKAVDYLKSKEFNERHIEVDEIELANYKKQSDRRADRNEQKALKRSRSGREKEAILCHRLSSFFAILSIILFICGIVSIPLVALSLLEVGLLVGFFIAAVFIFIIFGMYQARSEQLVKMNDDEYRKEQEAYIELRQISEEERAVKEERKELKRWMRFLHFMGLLSIGKAFYNGLTGKKKDK